jgi:hypothetical protein
LGCDTGNSGLGNRFGLIKRTGNLRETLDHVRLRSLAANRLRAHYAL